MGDNKGIHQSQGLSSRSPSLAAKNVDRILKNFQVKIAGELVHCFQNGSYDGRAILYQVRPTIESIFLNIYSMRVSFQILYIKDKWFIILA